jgi:hypothetical protein
MKDTEQLSEKHLIGLTIKSVQVNSLCPLDVSFTFDTGAKLGTSCLISVVPGGIELEDFEGKAVINALCRNEGSDDSQLVIELTEGISIIIGTHNPPFPYYCCAELEVPGKGIISFGLDESETG